MRNDFLGLGGLFAAALICALAGAPRLASAQDATEAAAISAAPLPGADNSVADADAPLSAEDGALLADALVFDAPDAAPAKTLRRPGAAEAKGVEVDTSGQNSGTVVLKQSLATEWQTSIGADLDLGRNRVEPYRSFKPLAPQYDGNARGAAWASVGVPNLASVDARIDPANDQGRLGTTFSRSLPVANGFSLTLQNSFSVTENYGQPQTAPDDLPLMAVPPPDPSMLPAPYVFGREGVAKFNILPTGTTLGAGLSSTSDDPALHNTLSAEQKIAGPLSVTTAITDAGKPTASTSLGANFKLTW